MTKQTKSIPGVYRKTRDKALLPTVFVGLAVTLLEMGRGLWHHDSGLIWEEIGWGLLTAFFYAIYRKTRI